MNTSQILNDVSKRINDPLFRDGKYAPVVLRAMNRVYRYLCRETLAVEKKYVMDFGRRNDHNATVDGNQSSVNIIAVASGHDIEATEEVYSRAWMGARTVSSVASTTITIDGFAVNISDEQEITTMGDEFPIPTDIIRPYRIYPRIWFREPGKFSVGQSNIFTISHGSFKFGSAGENIAYELWYFSSGFTIVDKSDANLSAGEVNSPEWPYTDFDDILFYGTCIEIANDYPLYKNDLVKYNKMEEALFEATAHKQDVTADILGGTGDWGGYLDVYEKPGYLVQDTD